MGMPFSRARNCSSFSAASSGETGNLTRRNSVSRRYPYMPRCFKNGNAANCSLTEPLAASRKYGIVRREKYSAWPPALTTTFTTFGLSYSSGLLMGVAAVDISAAASARATASMTPGSISGSSPWMFTMASQAQREDTSAIRSEPLGWVGAVISTRQKP